MQNLPLDKDTASIVNEYLMVSKDEIRNAKKQIVEQIKEIKWADFRENFMRFHTKKAWRKGLIFQHKEVLKRTKCETCEKKMIIGEISYDLGMYCRSCMPEDLDKLVDFDIEQAESIIRHGWTY